MPTRRKAAKARPTATAAELAEAQSQVDDARAAKTMEAQISQEEVKVETKTSRIC